MSTKSPLKPKIVLHNIEEIDFWNFPTNKKPNKIKR